MADLILGHLAARPDGSVNPAALRDEAFESVHNYIGEDNVIRKGAISARQGERCIIPLNMRDGALLATGRGNADWNHSAPHGAGRVMSRREAFERITMADYGAAMAGVYSETVTPDTRDEARWPTSRSPKSGATSARPSTSTTRFAPSSTSKRRSEPCGRRDGGKSHGCGTVSTQRGGASACGAGRLFLAVNQLEPTGGGGGCPNRRIFEREKRSTPCGT